MENLSGHIVGRFLAAVAVAAGLASPSHGEDAGTAALYQTQAVVSGTVAENRQAGFEKCFLDVVVKVSGDPRLSSENAVVALLPAAGSFVESFEYRDLYEGRLIHDEQGTYDRPHFLTCTFNRGKIDALLGSLGRKPWPAPRPSVAIIVAVDDRGRQFVLSSDGSEKPPMVESLTAAAGLVGMPIVVPTSDLLAKYGYSFEEVRVTSPELIPSDARRIGTDVAISGTLRWSDADLGWVASWRTYVDDTSYEWTVRGVGFDDAFRNLTRGTAQILSGHGAPN